MKDDDQLSVLSFLGNAAHDIAEPVLWDIGREVIFRYRLLATERKIDEIFCEGEQTEPRYFGGFKKLIEDNPIYRDMVLIQIEPCGAETMRVIGQAEQYVKENQITRGQIWCVYDKDSFPAQNFNGVVSRAESLNKENPLVQYHAAWSNECIEFWFMLHFAYYTSNNHRTEYLRFLNERYAQLGLGKYKKNSADTFDILMTHGNPKLAPLHQTILP